MVELYVSEDKSIKTIRQEMAGRRLLQALKEGIPTCSSVFQQIFVYYHIEMEAGGQNHSGF